MAIHVSDDLIHRTRCQMEEPNEGTDDKELDVDPVTDVRLCGAWTHNTGGDFDRCHELQVEVVVVSVLKILAEDRLSQCFLI